MKVNFGNNNGFVKNAFVQIPEEERLDVAKKRAKQATVTAAATAGVFAITGLTSGLIMKSKGVNSHWLKALNIGAIAGIITHFAMVTGDSIKNVLNLKNNDKI